MNGGPAPDDWRTAVFSQILNHKMIRTAEWKLSTCDGEPQELYDVKNDPDEMNNQVGDAALKPLRGELLRRMAEWEERTSSSGRAT